MDRLTCIVGNKSVPTKLNLDFIFDMGTKEWRKLNAIISRLAKYENIGLSPEEISLLKDKVQKQEDELQIVYHFADEMAGDIFKFVDSMSQPYETAKEYESWWRLLVKNNAK